MVNLVKSSKEKHKNEKYIFETSELREVVTKLDYGAYSTV